MQINPNAAANLYGDAKSRLATSDVGGPGDTVEQFAAIFDKADDAAQSLATGAIDTQAVVESFAQAEMALQAAVTVRDRIVGAYQELLRMPL